MNTPLIVNFFFFGYTKANIYDDDNKFRGISNKYNHYSV